MDLAGLKIQVVVVLVSGVPGTKSQGKGQVQPGRRAPSFGGDICQLGSNIMAMVPENFEPQLQNS